jgi:acetoacetate decarboxylase
MLSALDRSQLKRLRRRDPVLEFRDAEMLRVAFRTDPETVSSILPKPLRPADEPLAQAFVARYPATNFGVNYSEGALFLRAVHKDEPGWYCLAMPVDNDMAMVGGREQFGYPKKIADEITLDQDGDHFMGSVVRRGVEVLRIEADLTRPVDVAALDAIGPAASDLEGRPCRKGVSFQFKFSRSPNGRGFDFVPRLVREVVLFRPHDDLRSGTGRLVMVSSPYDPFGDIPVREIVTVSHGTWDNDMLPGRVAARVKNPLDFARHAMFKEDYAGWFLNKGEEELPPPPNRRQRKRLWKAIQEY